MEHFTPNSGRGTHVNMRSFTFVGPDGTIYQSTSVNVTGYDAQRSPNDDTFNDGSSHRTRPRKPEVPEGRVNFQKRVAAIPYAERFPRSGETATSSNSKTRPADESPSPSCPDGVGEEPGCSEDRSGNPRVRRETFSWWDTRTAADAGNNETGGTFQRGLDTERHAEHERRGIDKADWEQGRRGSNGGGK